MKSPEQLKPAQASLGKSSGASAATDKKTVKATSVTIYYAQHHAKLSRPMYKVGMGPDFGLEQAADVDVIICREIRPEHLEYAKKTGVKVGAAYIQRGAEQFEYIRDVDLNLSDKELAKQFGVEVEE